ncbi:hypothetical protein BDD12DRAFT_808971 [Trichophaea hybrida]|nr:hypothetical protein BDD12DRAFT_808971 [Trichophaea hybrida]
MCDLTSSLCWAPRHSTSSVWSLWTSGVSNWRVKPFHLLKGALDAQNLTRPPVPVRSKKSTSLNTTNTTHTPPPHTTMVTPPLPTHHRSSSTSSLVAQTAQSLFLRLSNASTLHFDSSPPSRTPSTSTSTPSPPARTPSPSPPRDPTYTFFTSPRFTAWHSTREQRRAASAKAHTLDPSHTRRNYISELRASVLEEYGADLLHYVSGFPSPLATPTEEKTEPTDNTVYTHILSLREQIVAANEADELQRRRELHRNFSVFIPAPATPRKVSVETERACRHSQTSMVSVSPRTEYFPSPTRDTFSPPGSPLDPTSHWRPPSTFWQRRSEVSTASSTMRYDEVTAKPAETFAEMQVVRMADTKEPPTGAKGGLFRSRTLSVRKENRKPEGGKGKRDSTGTGEKERRKKDRVSGGGGILDRAKTMRWGGVGSLGGRFEDREEWGSGVLDLGPTTTVPTIQMWGLYYPFANPIFSGPEQFSIPKQSDQPPSDL